MRTLISGAGGTVGQFIAHALRRTGHEVIIGTRKPAGPAQLELHLDSKRNQIEAFTGVSAFVHAAFDHVPGRYRGGEGDDPEGFRRRNLYGTISLFEQARAAGVRRAVFLSSRAVYGQQPSGMELRETTEPRPDTLYGEVKLQAERTLLELSNRSFAVSVLRITGVYGGPPERNKWAPLIRSWLAGDEVEARAGTEVHGRDVAAAVELVLEVQAREVAGLIFNVSDILVDTRDILAVAADVTGCLHTLPLEAEKASVNVMSTSKLRALGWQPGGMGLFRDEVRALAQLLRSS
jgi:nucleoside-diphosphate-sugar epimerase